jgi:hypothetical protein
MFEKYFTKETRNRFFDIFTKVHKENKRDFSNFDDALVEKKLYEHKAYFDYWDENGFDEYEWVENDINPFVHTLMHYIVEKEIKGDSEISKAMIDFYNMRKRKFMKPHDIYHMLAQIIAINTFKEMRGEGKFDKKNFLEDLKKYSSWNKKKFWNFFVPDEEDEEE